MKLIWQGTDSLFLVRFPKQLRWTKIFYILGLRLFARLSDLFVQEHYYCGDLVASNIKRFGLKKKAVMFQDRLCYPDKITKIPHEGFNVLYYYPSNNTLFNQWLYGFDIYLGVIMELIPFLDIKFVVVDGSQDMTAIYPKIDLMIRPCRHDGHPRMVDECKLNNIPYICTNQNPDVETFVKQILYERRQVSKQ